MHSTTVYLLHFVRKLGNQDNPRGQAQHYIGFAEHDLAARLERHHAGNGSRIMAAVAKAGIPWVLARVWEGGTRADERRLKSLKHASRLCPSQACIAFVSVLSRRGGAAGACSWSPPDARCSPGTVLPLIDDCCRWPLVNLTRGLKKSRPNRVDPRKRPLFFHGIETSLANSHVERLPMQRQKYRRRNG